jgi:hypothetical protein
MELQYKITVNMEAHFVTEITVFVEQANSMAVEMTKMSGVNKNLFYTLFTGSFVLYFKDGCGNQ